MSKRICILAQRPSMAPALLANDLGASARDREGTATAIGGEESCLEAQRKSAGAREWKKGPKTSLRALNTGGAERDRTADLCVANASLSQLSYGP